MTPSQSLGSLLALAVVATAPAVAAPADKAHTAGFLYGMTTPAELIAVLGGPTRTSEMEDGHFRKLEYDEGPVLASFRVDARGGEPTLFFLRIGEAVLVGPDTPMTLRTRKDLHRIDRRRGLRNVSVAKLDLRDEGEVLSSLTFDTRTVWPRADRMPKGFDPVKLLEQGKDPGLGVRALHAEDIDGRGVGVAIIDQPLLLGHREYASALVHYDAAGFVDFEPQMHAPPVSSIAVGRSLGVAPHASLSFYATPAWEADNHRYAAALDDIVARNARPNVSAAERVRVVSVSYGGFEQQKDFAVWQAAVARAEATGMIVVTCAAAPPLDYSGLSWIAGRDRDDPSSYEIVAWAKGGRAMPLYVPVGRRTVATETGIDVYAFEDNNAGLSWGAPYLAGLAALAFQVRPSITADEIRAALVDTATRTSVGPIVDPRAFIARVRAPPTR